MYVRKEAVLSSQIEGTESSLADLLLFELEEAPGVPLDDVTEVSNYVAAMEHGLRRLRSPEAFRRLLELEPSPHHGLGFCQGCFGEMCADVPAEIRYFGSRGRIFFVDFRNVRGVTERFEETFPDDGDVDMVECMRAFKEVGLTGPVCPDHTLKIAGDSDWGHRYWSYAIGHTRGLAQAFGI